MLSRGLHILAGLLAMLSLGACDWRSEAPLLTEADYVTPAIAGKYTMTMDGVPDPARIIEKPGRQFGLIDSGNRELIFSLAALPAFEAGVELFLAEATEKPEKYEYFIVSLESGRLHVYLPVCQNTAPRFGIEETDAGKCKFTSRSALMEAARDVAADMRTAKVRASGFAILRPDKG